MQRADNILLTLVTQWR